GTSNVGKSRIESIQECGTSTASSNCFAPVEFAWSGANQKSFVGYAKKISNFGADHSEWESNYPRMMADVNGDGRADVVGFGKQGVYVSESTGTGFKAPELRQADYGYNQGWRVNQHERTMADVDGDGRADVVGFYNDGVYVSKSTGTGFEAKKRWVAAYGYSAGGWRVGKHLRTLSDVDGDGLADVVGFADNGVQVALSTGTSFKTPVIWKTNYGGHAGWTYTNHPRMLRDVNGDGLADIVGFGDSGVYVSLSTGTSFSGMSLWHSDFGYHDGYRGATHPRMVSDVNGDGLADLVVIAGNGVYVALSSGTKFLSKSHWVAQYGADYGWQVAKHPRMLADINGDRIPDMIGFDNAGVKASLSTGSDLETPNSWIDSFGFNADWSKDDHPRVLADINGDGIDDIIGFADAGVYTATSANDSGKPRITSITNGLIPKATIEYQSLAGGGGSIYTRNYVDSRGIPMFVVKSVQKGNGIGGQNSTDYHYHNLKFDLDGRGSKGFRKVVMTDSATDTVTTTTYSQYYPYIGMQLEVSQRLNNVLISKTVNAYKSFPSATARSSGVSDPIYVVHSLSVEYSYDYNTASLYKTIITETGYAGSTRKIDDYGNVEWVRVTTRDANNNSYSQETTSTYDDTPANWILGRLDTASVTHSSPGSSITRESAFSYYSNGLLRTETVEPNQSNTPLNKVSSYQYDANGLRSRVDETGYDYQGNILPTRWATTSTTSTIEEGEPAQKTTITNAQNESEISWTSMIHGGVVKHMGPNGKITTTEYDTLGRAIKTTNHLGVVSLTEYAWTNHDPLRSVYKITKSTKEKSGAGAIEDEKTIYYDELNRKIRTQNRTMDGR
ncbi:MAG: hypothetical protein GY942_04270, partial [Aestuariibacter sp.]|nr:hypothetical protein [Aestuariibacter sp.]